MFPGNQVISNMVILIGVFLGYKIKGQGDCVARNGSYTTEL